MDVARGVLVHPPKLTKGLLYTISPYPLPPSCCVPNTLHIKVSVIRIINKIYCYMQVFRQLLVFGFEAILSKVSGTPDTVLNLC